MAITSALSDGAKKRLFNIAFKANKRVEECVGESDEDYKASKQRSDQWNEIVAVLGLENELRQYVSEQMGEQ